MKNQEIIIEKKPHYTIYLSDGRYFVDIHREITHSYKTLAGAREFIYYHFL